MINLTANEWLAVISGQQPFKPCDQPWGGMVAGKPVSCTLQENHVQEKHYNHELKINWY